MLYLSKLSYDPFIGNGQPTSTTNLPTHYVGRLYVDTQTGLTYRLIQDATDNNVWEVIGDGTVKTDAADVAGYLDSKLDTAYFKIVNHKLTIEETGIAKTDLSNVDANDILTKLLTVDGNGSGLDADNLDGLDSIQFVRSDQDDTMNGNYTIIGNLNVDGNTVIQGDLTVNGTTTTIDTINLEIEDNEIVLNKGETGSGVNEGYAGIRIERGTETDARLIYDETDDSWKIDPGDGNLYNILISSSGGGLDADTLDGLDSSQFLRSDINDSWNGILTTIKDGDRVVLQPETSGQWVGIRFDSQTNVNTLGYIRWYDENNDYNFPNNLSNGAFVLGTENANFVLKSPSNVIFDTNKLRTLVNGNVGDVIFYTFILLTQDINAYSNMYFLVDTTNNEINVTLEATPDENSIIHFSDIGGNLQTNNLIISGNGNTIMGSTTLIVDVNYKSFTLLYKDNDWKIV